MKSAWAGWNCFFSTLPLERRRARRAASQSSVSLPGAGSSSHSCPGQRAGSQRREKSVSANRATCRSQRLGRLAPSAVGVRRRLPFAVSPYEAPRRRRRARCGGCIRRGNPGSQGRDWLARAAKAAAGQVAERERGCFARKAAICPSSSAGANAGRVDEHAARSQQRRRVFENFGPQLRTSAPLRRYCAGRRRRPPCGTYPRPEQGASTSTRSNCPGTPRPGGRCPVRDDGVRHAHSLEILAQNFSAAATNSLASSRPCPCRAAASWLVLPSRRGAEVGQFAYPAARPASAAGAEALGPVHRARPRGARRAPWRKSAAVVKAVGQNGDGFASKSACCANHSGVQRSALTVTPRAGCGVAWGVQPRQSAPPAGARSRAVKSCGNSIAAPSA